MAKVNFSYIKTGTGELSGPSFATQTELAINELGSYVETVETTAGNALTTANAAQAAADTAQTTANSALSQAQTATALANQAQQAANAAQNTANNAQTAAQTAQTAANSAQDTADEALAAAQGAQGSADSKAPVMHASASTIYGSASDTLYGHVQLSDAISGTQTAATGSTAATPYAIAQVSAIANTAQQTANAAQNTANQTQTSLNQFVENVNQQLAILSAKALFVSQDDAISAEAYAGGVYRLYLTSSASASTGLPSGITYPCYFWTETTSDGDTSIMYVVSDNILWSQTGVVTSTSGDTPTWSFTGWQQITYTAATTSALGVVRPDGTTVEVAPDGTLSINTDLLSTVYKFKGSVATVDDLPAGAARGDVYNVTATDANYAWTGSAWDNIGGIEAVDSAPVRGSTNPVSSGGVYTALSNLQTELEGEISAATVPPSTTTPLVAGSAAVGTQTAYARGDHVHPAQVNITGNAATATKATQDANGNIITSTYATQAELSSLQTELEGQIASSTATPDGVTIANNSANKLMAQDVAIGGDASDLASASGLLGKCVYVTSTSNPDFDIDTRVFDTALINVSVGIPGTFPTGITGWCVVVQYNYNRTSTGSRVQLLYNIAYGGFQPGRAYIRYYWSSLGGWTDWNPFLTAAQVGDGITVNNGIISVPEYEGATSSAAGTAGLVPAPAAGGEGRPLRGDGTWADSLTCGITGNAAPAPPAPSPPSAPVFPPV